MFVPIEYIAEGRYGDLCFLMGTGDKARKYCMALSLLSSLSPVFHVVLTDGFSERTQLSLPPEEQDGIWFRDDDSLAMKILFDLVHRRTTEMPDLTATEIENLAVLIDKYQFSGTLKPWASKLLGTTEGLAHSFPSAVKRLCLSYAFDEHKEFLAAARCVLWDYSKCDIINAKVDEERFVTLLRMMPKDFSE